MNTPKSEKYIFSYIICCGIPNELVEKYIKLTHHYLLNINEKNIGTLWILKEFLLDNIKGYNKNDPYKIENALSIFRKKLIKLGWSEYPLHSGFFFPFDPLDDFKLNIFKSSYGKTKD